MSAKGVYFLTLSCDTPGHFGQRRRFVFEASGKIAAREMASKAGWRLPQISGVAICHACVRRGWPKKMRMYQEQLHAQAPRKAQEATSEASIEARSQSETSASPTGWSNGQQHESEMMDDPVIYAIEVRHWQDGDIDVSVSDVCSEKNDRIAVAAALRRIAEQFETGQLDTAKNQ